MNIIFFYFLLLFAQKIYSDVCGKIDTGPVYVEIDKLENNRVVERNKLWGLKSDAVFIFENGIGIKPSVMFSNAKTRFYNIGCGLGVCIPIKECLHVFPNAGCFFGKYRTHYDHWNGAVDVCETIKTTSPYVGLDVSYQFWNDWSVCGIFQYSWAKVMTRYEGMMVFLWARSDFDLLFREHTQGINFSFLLERALFENVSLSLGTGYNASLSKEKRGLRGKGVKIGLVYKF